MMHNAATEYYKLQHSWRQHHNPSVLWCCWLGEMNGIGLVSCSKGTKKLTFAHPTKPGVAQ